MKRLLLSAFALFFAAALPAHAQSEQPARAEILPGWVQADGSRMAALQITLAPGWKTYWRSPGDAGIPPQFDWSRSRNLRGVGIVWPAPKVYPQNGMQTIGYQDRLILPLQIRAKRDSKPVQLRARLDIGVCKDVCIPFQIDVEGTLQGETRKPTPAIAAALAARPFSAAEAGVKAASCSLRPTADGLEIEARLSLPATGNREVVVIEPGRPDLWMSPTDVQRQGRQLIAKGDIVPNSGQAVALDRSAVVITVIGSSRTVEIKGCTAG